MKPEVTNKAQKGTHLRSLEAGKTRRKIIHQSLGKGRPQDPPREEFRERRGKGELNEKRQEPVKRKDRGQNDFADG